MIEYKNSKHMICVHKSAFSGVFATRYAEKLLLVGDGLSVSPSGSFVATSPRTGRPPQTPRREKYPEKISD